MENEVAYLETQSGEIIKVSPSKAVSFHRVDVDVYFNLFSSPRA